ncbi:MAG: bifunctional phosphoribosylaminoimidazolecarboxamide formyltransferase/IMP cyclohydrolase [Bacteriovoracaceae bacterium]|nr:bifunctional phosphoribosylaminoimidazolecarboxamide formyltransferase/IMP cyclohydrolase [Bacteriovoracaceae bacterium]
MEKFKTNHLKIKRALVSVTDKSDLAQIAAVLSKYDIEIISSGGTGKFLTDNGYQFTPVQDLTGNPEVFGGRMKTLSFQISSALLFRRNHSDDLNQAEQLKILPIDLVICNLYPFQKIAAENKPLEDLVENIDIGGPTMIRCAAKNFESVLVITSPEQYPSFIEELNKTKGSISYFKRKKNSLEAFKLMANYEIAIVKKFEKSLFTDEEQQVLDIEQNNNLQFRTYIDSDKGEALRYGENPHQKAIIVKTKDGDSLANATPLQGKDLSYNNYLDADAALRCCHDISILNQELGFNKSVVIVKHLNPCGAAMTGCLITSLEKAWAADPISSFGSIMAFSDIVTDKEAIWLSDKFIEVLIAPDFTAEAMDIFSKKKNLRVLQLDPSSIDMNHKIMRTIDGGVIIQDEDSVVDKEFENVTKIKFPDIKVALAKFGIMITKHFKSNAIALFNRDQDGLYLIGAGMGNPNRLISTMQAIDKARENGHTDLTDSVLVSDAFFPFKDNIQMANKEGVRFIVQPGGSIKDKDVISCCDDIKASMLFTGRRHFRH